MKETNDLNELTVETIAEKEAEPAKKPEMKGETVTIWLPAEGIGDALEGCLNGVNFRIPTEQSVEVPARIAALIKESRKALLDSSRAVQAYQDLGGRKIG